MRTSRSLLATALLVSCFAASVAGQSEINRPCTAVAPDANRRYCYSIAEAIAVGLPRLGIAFSSGNPVPGAASTLGERVGSMPRLSGDARITLLSLELPPIGRMNASPEIGATLLTLNIDASVGIFGGIALLPTVGGFASLDLLGSIGTMALPEDEGFDTGRVHSWALGARLGILRESFTAPGISITGVYRRLGSPSFGDRQLQSQDAYFEANSLRVQSLRAVVGKRVLGLGALAGVGIDRYQSEVSFGQGGSGQPRFDFQVPDFETSRFNAFGSLHWTTLIVSLVGEIGWQSGGDELTAPLPAGQSTATGQGTLYGGLAVRLAL